MCVFFKIYRGPDVRRKPLCEFEGEMRLFRLGGQSEKPKAADQHV